MSVKVNEIVRGSKRLALLLGAFTMNICPAETVSGEPDAYLDYIVANGSQYIDTGVNAETGLKVRADFAWGGSSSDNNDWGLVGAKLSGSSDNARRMLMIHMWSQKPFVGYGLGARGNPGNATNFTRGVRCEVVADFSDASALEIYQNGAKALTASDQSKYAAQGNVDIGLPLYAFAYNDAGSAAGKCKATLYGLRILRKNVSGGFDLVRNYLPCLKDGRAALYDTVNNEVRFSDSGTDFAEGPVLPRPVEFVEWIASDANTINSNNQPVIQYVDTRVIGKSGIRSAVDVMLLNDYSGDHGILACRKTNSGAEIDSRFYMAYYYQSVFRYAYMTLPTTNEIVNVSSTTPRGRYFIESDFSLTNQSVKVNGTELHKEGVAHSNVYFNTGTHLTLFGMRDAEGFKVRTLMRLYSCKIWDGDELMRDYLPCVSDDGKAGLYDTVSRRMFTAGTPNPFDLEVGVGACTNAAPIPVGTLPDTKISYIESDGANDYFNLEVPAKDGVEMEAVMEWVTVPADGAFVGARTDTQVNDKGNTGVRFYPYHHWNDHGSGHRIAYSGQLPGNGAIATAGTKYRIRSHLDDGAQWYTVEASQNGAWSAPVRVRVDPAYAGPVDTGLPLYLFAVNYDGEPKYPGHARVYRLKFWEKQQDGSYALTRDFVPCKKDGRAMLFDKVSGRFFRNQGSYYTIGGGHERVWFTGTRLIVR